MFATIFSKYFLTTSNKYSIVRFIYWDPSYSKLKWLMGMAGMWLTTTSPFGALLKVRFSDDPWPWLKSVIGDFLPRKPTVQSVLLWQER